MAHSFTKIPVSPGGSAARRRVLVTGAAGRIGSCFAEQTHQRYDLRLMVRGDESRIESIKPFGEVVTANLADLPELKRSCQGIDTVVHLAANPSPSATWRELLPDNIVGTYNMMVAAKSASVRRVIYASSVHAVGGYPTDVQVKNSEPVNPGDLYGVSKCFGEALGRYMAEQEGLSVIALRIGGFQPVEEIQKGNRVSGAAMFVSPRDLVQLISKCIETDGLKWAVFNAVSNNAFKRLDITDARELVGYAPQDNAATLAPEFQAANLTNPLHSASLRDPGQKSGLREDL
ncbi:MAG TPA: NAD(P)-dependent oxidoreductase [Tepidisphaeraceae bacterium]|nr:NAD(P)-dependent oxidoreductase [Tepidisphaeraceae bacterium]